MPLRKTSPKKILCVLLFAWLALPLAQIVHAQEAYAPTYVEPYRPQYHFSPAVNWMNDPNGLVYFDGEYHLFYQYNPDGIQWGHMSWGHAVSADLVHWEHLPVAISEEDGVMIFSGSAVVDHDNTSGFGTAEDPPMVAIYTGHRGAEGRQTQDIAYSTDRGRTWEKYEGNPVIDSERSDFRDPNVFWYEPDQKWVMVVVLPTEYKVQFYESEDLKAWSLMSEFGPAGATEGIWECPDLFGLPVDGNPDETRWVLEVDLNAGAVADAFECPVVCITRGARGAMMWKEGAWFEHAGHAVEVKDLVGAGDAFLAALLAGLLSEIEGEKLLDLANRLGAYVATQFGGTPAYDVQALDEIRSLPLLRHEQQMAEGKQ